MRGAFVAIENNCLVPYARLVFRRYWTDERDISLDAELASIVADVGMDTEAFFAKINDQSCKDRLKRNTDELIRRGGFGSPTLFLNGDDMYFGNDRIVLLEAKLAS